MSFVQRSRPADCRGIVRPAVPQILHAGCNPVLKAGRTQQWLGRLHSPWKHPEAYSISFLMTQFQAATTIGW